MYIKSLVPSSKFIGKQKSERSAYPVTVEFKHIDFERSYVAGFLTITGLIKEFPVLTTFFEGEIIGDRYSFLTRKWQADELKDKEHWGKFPAFAPYCKEFNNDDFKADFANSDFLFMRWKESFLVPDHRVRSIEGASYDGFYYICYQKSTDVITGYYYHHSHHTADMYQSLELTHEPQRGSPVFDFR